MAHDPSSLGALLRRYRKDAALTQEELAERAQVSARTVGDIECGVSRAPQMHTVRRLADALELSTAERKWFEAASRRSAAPVHPAEHRSLRGGFLGVLPELPLVGRAEEWSWLLAAVDGVEEGSGRLALLAGEAGVGKTRLAQEADLTARERRFIVGTGRCFESQQSVRFIPFRDALAALWAQVPAAIRTHAPHRWPHLAHLLPGEIGPPTPTTDAVEGEQLLLRAATGFILACAEEAPVALLLDDLQWADEESLGLLAHLARNVRGARVLLLGTFRDDALERDSPLWRALRDLGRERLVERLLVRRLSIDGTAAMVAASLGEMEASEEFTEFIHRRTKGSPFFIDQMLRAMGGRYRLERQIGTGGMGRVFQAVDTETGQAVATKIMFASQEAGPDALLRFQREGTVLASLDHPHIVKVYGTFMEEHASCIAMELLEGRSLGELLRTRRPSLTRSKRILRQVCSALAFAHSRKIVHRDIKPDNIMLLDNDRVKVTDFGIARVLRPDATRHTLTGTGARLGTPLYMAPEQITGDPVDGRTDIYALGAVMYQMVTCRPPFEGDSAMTIAYKHVHEAPEPPRTFDADLPADWEATILKALAKDPADRYQSAAEMEQVIAGLTTAPTLQPPLPTLRVPAGEASGVRARRLPITPRPVATGLLVASLALVCALLFLHVSGSSVTAHPSTRAHLRVVNGWGPHALNPGPLKYPDGVAVDGKGNLYVADQLADQIRKLSPDGALIEVSGRQGSEKGQFDLPGGLAVEPHGNLYVADTNNNRIQKLSPALHPLAQWGTQGSGPGQFQSPQAVAVDDHGYIYVADTGNNRIQKLSATGRPLDQWVHGAGGLDLSSPAGVALDPQGNLYVADTGNNRIQELSPQGKPLRQWGGAGLGRGRLASPGAVAVDAHGDVYVADTGNTRIQEFSPKGGVLGAWGAEGAGSGQFSTPNSLAIDGRGKVYVTDAGNARIQRRSPGATSFAPWGTQRPAFSGFRSPGDAAVDAHGNVWVADTGNNRIEEFSSDGQVLAQWGEGGAGRGRLSSPSGIAVDGQGDIYVADTGNNRVQKLSPKGRPLRQWGSAGSGPGQFSAPYGVAVDGEGNIYVADTGNYRVVELSRTGRLLNQWGSQGSGPGQFQWPYGMAVDAGGIVYVADELNDRIERLTPGGRRFTDFGRAGFVGSVSAAGQFQGPDGVAVDGQGNVYVADTGNNRIQKLSPNGKVLAVIPAKGSQGGQFSLPEGIAVDGRGNVYVADTRNNRIQKLSPAE